MNDDVVWIILSENVGGYVPATEPLYLFVRSMSLVIEPTGAEEYVFRGIVPKL